MIKLIASDMDGTLLNSYSLISEENKRAILYAKKQGVEFMIATGRGRSEALPVLQKAGLTLPMITVNGAQVFDATGDILFTIDFKKHVVEKIITLLRKHRLYFELATSKGTFSDSHIKRITSTSYYLKNSRPAISPKLAIAMTAAHLELLHVQFVEDFTPVIEDPEIQILKFIVFGIQQEGAFSVLRKELGEIPDLAVTSSAKNNLEINPIDAQKGLAVERVAKEKGISLQHVMTIGDNFNDVSMLKIAGISYAMENGPEEVQRQAKFLAKNNNENGVAEAIYEALSRDYPQSN